MKVLVCGARDLTDGVWFRDRFEKIAAEKFPISEPDEYGNYLYRVYIIAGKAKGIDTLAIDWAVVNWCPFTEYPADWDKYGSKAGPIRNQQMIDEGKPDLIIAFPSKNSKGTWDMVRRAKKAGVEVIVHQDEDG